MYYVKHVIAAATGPLVLAACMLVAAAVYGTLNWKVALAVIIGAQLLFPLFLLVSTLIGKLKVLSGLPPSVLIACLATVLFVLPIVISTLVNGQLFLLVSAKWMLHLAAPAVGVWGSYMLYMSIKPKQKLALHL